MSKSERDYIKRHLAHAMYDTLIAMQHIGTAYDMTLPQHPELAEKLMVCIHGYEVIAGVIKSFAQTITGRDEINWEAWRALSNLQLALQEPVAPELQYLYKQTTAHTTKKLPKWTKKNKHHGITTIEHENPYNPPDE